VAERNSLLNCRTGNGTEGSNPSLSANKKPHYCGSYLDSREYKFITVICKDLNRTEKKNKNKFAKVVKKPTFAIPIQTSSGCSVARYRACFGSRRPQVRILPSRLRHSLNEYKTL
jgi:hypothetical protein